MPHNGRGEFVVSHFAVHGIFSHVVSQFNHHHTLVVERFNCYPFPDEKTGDAG